MPTQLASLRFGCEIKTDQPSDCSRRNENKPEQNNELCALQVEIADNGIGGFQILVLTKPQLQYFECVMMCPCFSVFE